MRGKSNTHRQNKENNEGGETRQLRDMEDWREELGVFMRG